MSNEPIANENTMTQIDDAIEKKDLIRRTDMDKRLQDYVLTGAIEAMIESAISPMVDLVDEFTKTFTKTSLAQQETVKFHARQLTGLRTGHEDQQRRLAKLDAVLDVVNDGIPSIKSGIADIKLSVGILEERIENVDNDTSESIKRLDMSILSRVAESRKLENQFLLIKNKIDERDLFYAKLRQSAIKWTPRIILALVGTTSTGLGLSELLRGIGG